MAPQFAIVGDSFVDVVAGPLERLPQQWGEDTQSINPIVLQSGGSALNTSFHLASLLETLDSKDHASKKQVMLHTALGMDDFGKFLKQKIQNAQVDLQAATLPNVPTGVCIVLSGNNDRSFVTHYGATGLFSIQHLHIEKLLQAQHIHLAGFYSCSTLSKEITPVLKLAKEKGITISLDTNYDSSNQWRGFDLFPYIDILLPNETEAMKISKTNSVQDAFQYFLNYIPIVVITIGEQGAIAKQKCSRTNNITTWTQTSFTSNVVDVTGAGDSFNAGFLYGWKILQSIPHALQLGCALASLTIQNVGASSKTYTLQQVQSILQETQTF